MDTMHSRALLVSVCECRLTTAPVRGPAPSAAVAAEPAAAPARWWQEEKAEQQQHTPAPSLDHADVFAVLQCGDQLRRTFTAPGGRSGCRFAWRGGGGQAFGFVPPNPELVSGPEAGPPEICLRLYADRGSDNGEPQDDWIAEATVDTSRTRTGPGSAPPGGEDWASDGWFPLKGKDGAAAGEVRLFVRWQRPAPEGDSLPWRLHVTVFECDKLKRMSETYRNSPFVRLNLEPSHHRMSDPEDNADDGSIRAQCHLGPAVTPVRRGAGARPKWQVGTGEAKRWDQCMGETLHFELAEVPPSIGVEVWNRDTDEHDDASDSLIGRHVWLLGTVLQRHLTDPWSHEEWLDLSGESSSSGEHTGRVRIKIAWHRSDCEDPNAMVRNVVPLDSKVVRLMADEYAHDGEDAGMFARTVFYTPGSAATLLQETARRFNTQDVLLFCKVPEPEPEQQASESQQPYAWTVLEDAVLYQRVTFETCYRWVEKTTSDGIKLWQRWKGSEEVVPADIVFDPPKAEADQYAAHPLQLASITTDADLAALRPDQQLWALDLSLRKASRAAAGTEAAAITLNKAGRSRRLRENEESSSQKIAAIQAIHRGRMARRRLEAKARRKKEKEDALSRTAAGDEFAESLREARALLARLDAKSSKLLQTEQANETLLRDTPGWVLYTAGEKEIQATSLTKLDSELAACVFAHEMEAALEEYNSTGVAEQDVVARTKQKIQDKHAAEARAISDIESMTAKSAAECEKLVAATQNMDYKESSTKRRFPMATVLTRLQDAINDAQAAQTVPAELLAKAQKLLARIDRDERERCAEEDAARKADDSSLDAAFVQTMKHMFSNRYGAYADGKTAHERTLEKRQRELEEELRIKRWAVVQAENKALDYNLPPAKVLNGGHAYGVFIRTSSSSSSSGGGGGGGGGDGRADRPASRSRGLAYAAPSNDLIPPSYAALIAARHPEEVDRGGRDEAAVLETASLRLKQEQIKQEQEQRKLEQQRLAVAIVGETGALSTSLSSSTSSAPRQSDSANAPFQALLPQSRRRRRQMMLADGRRLSTARPQTTPGSYAMSGRRSTGGNNSSSSISSSMRGGEATPTSTASFAAGIDGETPSRPDLVRDALGFYPSYSHTLSAMRAQEDGFLEGLVQHGVQQLREGKCLPPLSQGLRGRRRPQTSPSPLPVDRAHAALEDVGIANEFGFGTSDKAAAEAEAITAAAPKASTRQLFAGAGMEVATTKKGSGGRRAATVPAASFSLSQQVTAVRTSLEAEYR